MKELDFEDILKMGGDRAYKLFHDIHENDMKRETAIRRIFIEKKQLLFDAVNCTAINLLRKV